MGRQIHFAWRIEDVGKGVASNRLQGVAGGGADVAVVDDQHRTAVPAEPSGQSGHDRRGGRGDLENVALVGAIERGVGVGFGQSSRTEPEREIAIVVEPDHAFDPGISRALELADRQGVEEFIGNPEKRDLRQVVRGIVPMRRLPDRRERIALARPQHRARLDQVDLCRGEEFGHHTGGP